MLPCVRDLTPGPVRYLLSSRTGQAPPHFGPPLQILSVNSCTFRFVSSAKGIKARCMAITVIA